MYQYCKRTVLFTFVTDEHRSISQDIKSDIEQKTKINYIISVKAFFHTNKKKKNKNYTGVFYNAKQFKASHSQYDFNLCTVRLYHYRG